MLRTSAHPPGGFYATKFAWSEDSEELLIDSRVRCAAQFGKPRKAVECSGVHTREASAISTASRQNTAAHGIPQPWSFFL